MKRIVLRSAAAVATVVVIGMSSAASAHIRVTSDDAQSGAESATLVFRVPTESATASTTSISVTMPVAPPFARVTPAVKPGWRVSIQTEKLAKPIKVGDFTLTKTVRSVTWKSDGKGIPVNQFDEFTLAVGPLPKTGKVSFVAAQKYSDGQVVTWDQARKGDTEPEPEHPAPALELTAATSKSDNPARTADWLSGAALVVAVGAAVFVVRQNRRRA